MDKTTLAVLVAIGMSCFGISGDYFIKLASNEERPLASYSFWLGALLYASTAFAWVFLMRYLKLATIGVVYSVSMIVLLALMGAIFFEEKLSRTEMVGIVLAVAAILLLSRGE